MPDRKINPFGSSRVDTPFQNHVDLKAIYQSEFGRLLAIIEDIEQDTDNHQSKGAVVIGEPGSGKTHLMMRLAQARLKTNRLLFIRQPNNLNAVLYHIYSRVLESFAQPVPGSTYSQFEHFLANAFAKIIKQAVELSERTEAESLLGNLFTRRRMSHKYRDILESVSTNPLEIYQALGREGSHKKREYWQRIEKIVIEWWKQHYSEAGHATAIIQGIIKFCSYSDLNKRKLVGKWLAADELEPALLDNLGLKNWQAEMSRESFSLEALTVFGRLSIMDEPLIIVFDQLEALGLAYNENLLNSFGDAIKELFTHVPNSLIILNLFPDRWEHFKIFFDGAVVDRISQCQIVLAKPSPDKLREMLILKAWAQQIAIENIFSAEDLDTILGQESIRGVLNWASHFYRHRVEGIALPKATHFKRFEDELKTELATIKHQMADTADSEQYHKVEASIQELRAGLQAIFKEISAVRQTLEAVAGKIPWSSASSQLISVDPTDPKQATIFAYIEREKQILTQNFNDFTIISDADDMGKLRTIAEAFCPLREVTLDFLRLGRTTLPEHILLTHQDNKGYAIGFLQVKGNAFTTRIGNFNQLVLSEPGVQFLLFRDEREPSITAKVGASEIKKLNNAPNGHFIVMDKENRVIFELIAKLVTDILNKEEHFSLVEALEALETYFGDYWLVKIWH